MANHWWRLSIWFHVRSPLGVCISYGLFLAALVCFTCGFCSRPAAIVAWIGHVSYVQRGVYIASGLDSVLAMLTFYLIFATGEALSVDRVLRRFRESRAGLLETASARPTVPAPSWAANAVVRMIQLHMALIYLCSGLAKLQGGRWWDGTAVWMVMIHPDYAVFDLTWLARPGDWLWQLVSTAGVAFTLAFEIGFVFLIWNRLLRPAVLAAALACTWESRCSWGWKRSRWSCSRRSGLVRPSRSVHRSSPIGFSHSSSAHRLPTGLPSRNRTPLKGRIGGKRRKLMLNRTCSARVCVAPHEPRASPRRRSRSGRAGPGAFCTAASRRLFSALNRSSTALRASRTLAL